MLIQGVVGFPSASSNQATGMNATLPQDQQGAAMVTEVHGKFYVATKGTQNVYIASLGLQSGAATIPANAASLASKFCLVNPVGSNRVLELISLDLNLIATATAAAFGLVYQSGASNIAGLGTLTAAAIQSAYVGGGANSVCNFYSAATHTGTPSVLIVTHAQQSTSALQLGTNLYTFDGKIIVPPGTVIDLAGSAAGPTSGALPSLVWAEWPV